MTKSKPKTFCIALLLGLILGAGLFQLWGECRLSPVNDFLAYWTVTEYHAQHPEAPLYGFGADVSIAGFARAYHYDVSESLQHRWRKIPMYRSLSTPFMYWVISLFPRAYEDAWLLFLGISFFGAVFGVGWFMYRSGFCVVWGLFCGLLLVIGYGPIGGWAQSGNVGMLQLGMLALLSALLLEQKPWSALAVGLVSGLLVAFKPNVCPVILFVATWQVAGREWTRLKIEALGGLMALLVAYILGIGYTEQLFAWGNWLDAVSLLSSQFADLARMNFSLYILADHYFDAWDQMKWVSCLLLLLSLWGIYRVGRRSKCGNSMILLLVVQLGVLLSLIVSPLVWSHYYVLCIPALVVLTGYALNGRCVSLALVPAIVMLCLSVLPLLFFKIHQVEVQGLLAFGSLLGLYVACWAALCTHVRQTTDRDVKTPESAGDYHAS